MKMSSFCVAATLSCLVLLFNGCGHPGDSTNNGNKENFQTKSYSVSKGAFSGSISIEVSSIESITLSSLSYSRSKISLKITHDPIEGAHFRHGKDFYRYTAYDKDGVTLKESLIIHEAISPGETVLGQIHLAGVDDVARVVIHR